MSYLELAKRIRAGLDQGDSDPLVDAPIVQTREEVGAVLIESPRFGPVWVALTAEMAVNLRTEEAQRLQPRPVLTPADIAALAGKSEVAIKATLEVFRAFGSARVVQ